MLNITNLPDQANQTHNEILPHMSGWLLITNVGKDVEKLECWRTVVGMQNGGGARGQEWRDAYKKLKLESSHNGTSWYLHKRPEIEFQKDISTLNVLCNTLQKQSKWPRTAKQMNKRLCTHTMGLSALNKKEILQ